MLRFFVTSASAILLTACAVQEQRQLTFIKNGASYADYQRDSYDCERDTRMAAGSFGTGPIARANAQDFLLRCMTVKGWDFGFFPNGYI